MTSIFTIGYQGQSIETFVDVLLAHGIGHLLDVRERPYSRKPDFSKKRLAAHLAAVNIAYSHFAVLGTPKDLRDAVRRSHDYASFFAAMEQLVANQPEALAEALAHIHEQPCALLCFEANAAECHRLTVANALVERSPVPLAIVHL